MKKALADIFMGSGSYSYE
jgi:hypothetical protein